jgi:AcrR family transcriptional regulator
MVRTINREVHAVRRDAFIDVAQRLIQSQGYEDVSIGAILDELDASRGAFYHYFGSKADLLEAVIARMTDAVTAEVAPIIEDPDLTAVQKFEAFFGAIARYKAERTEFVLGLIKVWLSDENAIVREKFRKGLFTRIAPLLARIVAQGQAEGAFTTTGADETARVLVSLMLGANEAATDLYVARQAGTIAFDAVERTLGAYAEAFERVLGVRPGSLTFADQATLRHWYG